MAFFVKKLSKERLLKRETLNRRRWRRSLNRRYTKLGHIINPNGLRGQILQLQSDHPDVKINYERGKLNLTAPAILRLSQNIDETAQFLQCVRTAAAMKPPLLVDFSTIIDMSPLCAMLLASEIQRWQIIKNKRLRVLDKWDPKIARLFHDMGLFDLISVSNPFMLGPNETEERFIRIRSEQSVDLEKAVGTIENAGRIENEVTKIALMLNSSPWLYGGIEEAITNVIQWAYKLPEWQALPDELYNRWWFFASYNTASRRITLMVYDHGAGIPRTLPTFKWSEVLKKFLAEKGINTWSDEKILEAAMNLPRSASGEVYRAKGLRKMKELLSRFSKGSLVIYSGKGEYRVDHDGNAAVTLHNYPIGGTLVAWEVYVDNGMTNDQ